MNNATLNTERNKAKMKHIIMAKKIWTSLDSEFQIEIPGNEKDLTMGDAEVYNEPMLWDFIKKVRYAKN